MHYFSATLHAFASRSSRRLFSFHFTSKHCFHSGSIDFRFPACFRRKDSVRDIPARTRRLLPRLGGLPSGLPCTSLVLWLRADCRFPLFCLSACRMARGQEETSTSQAGRKRGPTRGTPFTSSIISSLSMEKLRAYCEILDDIDVMLSDGPTENTMGEEYNVVFFTQEQLATGLRFPVPSLVKQFLHFTRAPLALVNSNVIWILTGCCVLNLLYQLDLSLLEVCFAYTLRVAQGGRMSMLAQTLGCNSYRTL